MFAKQITCGASVSCYESWDCIPRQQRPRNAGSFVSFDIRLSLDVSKIIHKRNSHLLKMTVFFIYSNLPAPVSWPSATRSN
jgi:hypothetical protein